MRAPDRIIGDDPERPYLLRWWLTPWSNYERDEAKRTWRDKLKASLFHIYLHNILRSDDDRALHDHPWWNVSIVLAGGYWEHMPPPKTITKAITAAIDGTDLRITDTDFAIWRGPGSIVFRRATALHRLEIEKGSPHGAWTLFITGPRIREWGFACPQGWRHWRIFTSPLDPGRIGRGCAD